jgi:hypothetical protein
VAAVNPLDAEDLPEWPWYVDPIFLIAVVIIGVAGVVGVVWASPALRERRPPPRGDPAAHEHAILAARENTKSGS